MPNQTVDTSRSLVGLVKRAGRLGIGTAIGQGIVVAGTPFLVRVYGPYSFGVLALLLTLTNLAISLGCARFDLALASARDPDVTGLIRLCAAIAVALSIVAALIAFLIAPSLTDGPFRDLVGQPLLIGSVIVSGAAFQLVSSVQLRSGAVTSMAILRALQGVLFVVLALWPSIGLLWAHVLSFIPALLLLPTMVSGRARPCALSKVAARYRTFATVGLLGAVFDVIGYSLCIWIVTYQYGGTESGEWSQVQRVIGAPLMLVSVSLGQILLRESALMIDAPDALHRLLIRLLALMAVGSSVALGVLALVGEPVLDIVLGNDWDVDTQFILAISVAVFVRAIVSPVSTVLAAAQRFDLALRWQLLYFASALLLFTIMSSWLSIEKFVIFYALHEMALYLIYVYIIMSLFKKAGT